MFALADMLVTEAIWVFNFILLISFFCTICGMSSSAQVLPFQMQEVALKILAHLSTGNDENKHRIVQVSSCLVFSS